jgi:hypothetical protein
MSDMMQANEGLFDRVCELLQKGHQKRPHHTPLDTLNRLFEKHLKGKPDIAANAPRLTSMNTRATEETRSKQEFVDLAHPEGEGRDSSFPIVIVRFRGVDCLLDGNHRCRAWKASGDKSLHTAYVLTVYE